MQDPGSPGYRWWKPADCSHSTRTSHGAPPQGVIAVQQEQSSVGRLATRLQGHTAQNSDVSLCSERDTK